MKKTIRFLLLLMAVFVVSLVSACDFIVNVSSTQPVASNQPVPTSPASPVDPPPTQQDFASACMSCAAPAISPEKPANETYCKKKIPYQNFNVEPGTTFEELDPSGVFRCWDSGAFVTLDKPRSVDKQRLSVFTCTGEQLQTYDLKITSPSCNKIEPNPDRCQEGFGYDAKQNCCAPLTGENSGSVTIKVNMGACP